MEQVRAAVANIDRTILGYMALNFISSTSIIFTNKIVLGTYEFKYATFVTGCHFIITYLGVLYCKKKGFYQSKVLSHMRVLPITCAFLGFVIFNNLSLQYNSVGFYQLMKVLTTPVVALIQFYSYGIELSKTLQYSLVPVILGVMLASVSDVHLNFEGTVCAVLGILSTSYYQIFVKTKQKSLEANSFQVLEYQAPQAAVFAIVFSVPLDGMSWTNNPLSFTWSASLFLHSACPAALRFSSTCPSSWWSARRTPSATTSSDT